MGLEDANREQLTRTLRELRASIRDDVRDRWKGVRTAHRSQKSRQVWRFTSQGDSVERFLHVPHEAMAQGRDAASVVMEQLRKAKWLDRLQKGPEKSFVLSPSGRLQPWPKA